MAKVVIIGGSVSGLCAGMLLRQDGHDVTVLERDPGEPPPDPRDAWDAWQRRGINQFRLPHYFQPAFRAQLERELPAVADALRAAGALSLHLVEAIPDEVTGGPRPGDEELVALTGRRPVVEAALANAATAAGLDVRRGVAVAGLTARAGGQPPHVTGVRTEAGEELAADLVVDASGRRSPLPRWLADLGAAAPDEEACDLGFAYYGRHYRSADGSTPAMFGPPLQHYDSVSTLTLPADNGTWCTALVTAGNDAPLRAVRDVATWERVLASYPLVAHWLDGEPIDDDIRSMSKIEDRHRSLLAGGEPVVTGLVNVGDAWACTNPSVGRGASIALMHCVALRDTLRDTAAEAPGRLERAFHAATLATVEPWYRATVAFDDQRMIDVQAACRGVPAETDEVYEITRAVFNAAGKDADVLRAAIRMGSLLAFPDEVLADEALFAKIVELGGNWRDEPPPGPTRAELLRLVAD